MTISRWAGSVRWTGSVVGAVALAGVMSAAVVSAGVVSVAAAPTAIASASADGPGSYYVLRSQATGNPAKPEDDARCNAYLGFPHNVATVQRLDAVLYSPVVDATGTVTNGVAAPVAPAYLCGALGADGGLITSYARTVVPEAGLLEVAGPCGVSLALAQIGSALADCKLDPIPGTGSVAGVATTNSVVNPLEVPGAQTGSLITAYVLGAPHTAPGPAPLAPPKPVEGADFKILRAGSSVTKSSDPACPSGWRARVSTLYAAHPAAATGRIGDASGPPAGSVTACFEKKATSASVKARAVMKVTGSAPITAEGTCAQQSLPGITGSVSQTCGLWLKAPFGTIEDGLVSSSQLVPAGDSAGAANSGVWTVATLT